MKYFDDPKNRTLLGTFLGCVCLLELIFFGYGQEEMNSPLYPFLICLILSTAIPALSWFVELKRRMNSVFVGLACIVCSLFSALYYASVSYKGENLLLCVTKSDFWIKFALIASAAMADVFVCGAIKEKSKENYNKVTPFVNGLITSFIALSLGVTNAWGAVILFVFGIICGVISLRIKGGTYKVKWYITAAMSVGLVGLCVLTGKYKGGVLLYEEAALGAVILFMIAGIIVNAGGKRFGAYIYLFLSLHMIFAYASAVLTGAVDSSWALGMVPFTVTALIGWWSLKSGSGATVTEVSESKTVKTNSSIYYD